MKVRVTLTLEPEVIQILDKQALEGSRSRSGQVAWLVRQSGEFTDSLRRGPEMGEVKRQQPAPAESGAAEFFRAEPLMEAREGEDL